MKKLTILKRILDVAYFLLLLVAVTIAFFSFQIILSGADFPLPMEIFILSQLIAGMFYIYSVYLFRETIGYFKDRDVFNETVIKNFSIIGKCVIVTNLISGISYLVYKIIYGNNLGMEITIRYDALIISTFAGLFFMVLSEAFRMAKEMKEENELTV